MLPPNYHRVMDADQRLAIAALQHGLFVPGWALAEYLSEIAYQGSSGRVVLISDNTTPIGVGICMTQFIMLFVREDHRRKGIGTFIYRALLELKHFPEYPKVIYAHDDLSTAFIESL